jgi:hypothetical protein
MIKLHFEEISKISAEKKKLAAIRLRIKVQFF